MKELSKLANQTFIYGLSSIIGRLLNYLLVPLYTRCFSPSEYGVVTEIYAYVAFFTIILTYGMETAFFRFSVKEKNDRNVFSTTLISIIFSSIVFVFLMLLNSQQIASLIGYSNNQEYIVWFSIILALDSISAIIFARLRKKNQAVKFALVRIINIAVNIICNIYFILIKGFGIEYIFISNLISSGVMLMCLFPETIRISWKFNFSLWKKMLKYSSPLLIAGLAGVINETLDRALLKQLLPNSKTALYELGLYGGFYKLAMIVTLFVQTFRYAAEPFFFAQSNNKSSKKVYASIMEYFVMFMSVVFLLITTYYEFFVNFLGPTFHDERGFFVVSILLLANIFLGIYYNLSIWYKLTDKTYFGALFSLVGAVITIVMNLILIPKIGFVGSAITTLACYVVMTITSYFLSKKHYSIPYDLKRLFLYLMLMLILYTLIFYTSFSIYINTLLLVGFLLVLIILQKHKKKINFQA
mgnify:FL=1